ncbi:hypothetical protein [Rhodococcus kronopolitis]|uniref:MFS transporter n=1 Tax=Rhodococcus kronopolitis TaxID=1460226 RepID=A0ABV9FMY8_9NOCA
MRVGPGEKLSRRVRGTAVGGVTVAVAVAAHGIAGGGLPSGSTLVLLAGFAAVLVGVSAAIPVLRSGRPALVAVLAAGQVGAHLTLGVGGHHSGVSDSAVPSLGMVVAHVLAIGVCAAAIAAAERIGPRTEAALRAVVAAIFAAIPVAERARTWRPVVDVHPIVSALCRAATPRRGPPVLV